MNILQGLLGKESAEEAETKRLHELDLRHFRTVQFSDAWDGEETCYEGVTHTVLLYNGSIVYQWVVLKHCGATEGRSKTGDEFWVTAKLHARLFMQIRGIAADLYFGRSVEDDTVYPGETLETLRNHPQFISLVAELGVTLEPDSDNRVRVSVSKRYSTERDRAGYL